jgi:hypothetical protein
VGKNDVGLKRGQFRRVSASLVRLASRPTDLNPHVAADGPPQQRQLLQERPDAGLKYQIIRGCVQEHADAPHPLGLLRARRE